MRSPWLFLIVPAILNMTRGRSSPVSRDRSSPTMIVPHCVPVRPGGSGTTLEPALAQARLTALLGLNTPKNMLSVNLLVHRTDALSAEGFASPAADFVGPQELQDL